MNEELNEEHVDPQTIELDCAPGTMRPGDLITGVISETGLEPKEACSKFFGNWEWDYSDVPKEEWMKVRPLLKERVKSLYTHGYIRYGSW